MKAVVVTFPGSNCDYDGYHAFKQIGAEVGFLWHRETDLGDPDVVLLPGGFAHGDYLRPGAIARMSPIMESVTSFARAGGTVVGICNGFQVLCEAGLLPGALLRNVGIRFQGRDSWIRVENADTRFTSDYTVGQILRIPIAHADGNYHATEDVLERLEGEGRVIFRYVGPDGTYDPAYDPNGSANQIAGIVNEAGNVLGMMPHPERALDPLLGSEDGLGLFSSLLSSLTPA